MKRILLCLSILLLSFQGYSQEAEITTTSVHLRDSPSQSGASNAIIPQGTVLYPENCKDDWCEVSYQGQTGYVSSKYLKHGDGQSEIHTKASPTSPVHYYTNVNGNTVQSPTKYDQQPVGATARCADGTYSFSQHRRGTCSHHGGVAKWL